jgi:hypothetical protein
MPWFVLPRSRGCRSGDRIRLHSRAVRAIEQLYADALPGHLAELARGTPPRRADRRRRQLYRAASAATGLQPARRYQLPGGGRLALGSSTEQCREVDKRASLEIRGEKVARIRP